MRDPDFALNAVSGFIGTLFWGPEEYNHAMTLALGAGHVKDVFSTLPGILATSTAPKTAKSTLTTDIPMLLASRPWAVDRMTTTEALQNKFMESEPPDSLLADDVSKTFGESGTRGTTGKLYQLLINAYRRTAKTSVSRNGVAVDRPAYMMVFMNGLGNAVPRDLETRAIQFRLKPKPAHIRLRDALSDSAAREAEPLKAELHRWATSNRKVMRQFMQSGVLRVHPLLTDRLLQIWGPLFAVAHAAGGQWPRWCLDAFLMMGLDEGSDKPVPQRDEQALLDTAKIIMSAGANRVIFAADLVPALRELADDFYREVDDQYLVTDLLPRALGPLQLVRGRAMDGGHAQAMGWLAAPVLEAAADKHTELHPEPEPAGPDPVQDALTLRRG